MQAQVEESPRDFYLRLVRNEARSALHRVLKQNGLPVYATDGSQIQPVPVYEKSGADLLSLVSSKSPTEIFWPQTQADTYLPAYFKRYSSNDGEAYNQVVVISENYCQARFFAAKELMHGLIQDTDTHLEYPPSNTIGLVNQLIDELASGQNGMSCNPQTIVDEVAWIGAALYLIPNGWIPLLKQMVEDITKIAPESAAHAYMHVARTIRVPEVVLRIVLKLPYYQDI